MTSWKGGCEGGWRQRVVKICSINCPEAPRRDVSCELKECGPNIQKALVILQSKQYLDAILTTHNGQTNATITRLHPAMPATKPLTSTSPPTF